MVLSYVWNSQNVLNKLDIKVFIKQISHNQCIQSLYSDTNISSRSHFCSLYKTDFGFEKYLINLKKCRRIKISKFVCSNVKFPIETGRWVGALLKPLLHGIMILVSSTKKIQCKQCYYYVSCNC